MNKNTNCPLCEEGDSSHNYFCFHCGTIFHLHQKQLDMAPHALVILADCPHCKGTNIFIRTSGRLLQVKGLELGELPVTDLRGTGGVTGPRGSR